jgi:hypothetical protein
VARQSWPSALLRGLARWMELGARWLSERAQPAEREARAEPLLEAESPDSVEAPPWQERARRGPPEHWLERVREGAPQLLDPAYPEVALPPRGSGEPPGKETAAEAERGKDRQAPPPERSARPQIQNGQGIEQVMQRAQERETEGAQDAVGPATGMPAQKAEGEGRAGPPSIGETALAPIQAAEPEPPPPDAATPLPIARRRRRFKPPSQSRRHQTQRPHCRSRGAGLATPASDQRRKGATGQAGGCWKKCRPVPSKRRPRRDGAPTGVRLQRESSDRSSRRAKESDRLRLGSPERGRCQKPRHRR